MAATAEVADGPVMNMMSKRLRGLRKKYNRILQMEESFAQGKSLNKEQEEVLRSKPTVAALIEEYEKLRQPLTAALQEELSLVRPSASPATASSPPPPPAPENEHAEGKHVHDRGEAAAVTAGAGKRSRADPQPDPYAAIEDLLNLLYFGCLFDMKPQSDFASMVFTRAHERQCCLTYDYVTDDSTGFLREDDLDVISSLGSLIISRPVHSGVSHKNALHGCLEHAKLWLCKSEEPIQPGSSVTYAGLRERLKRILTSDYYTTTPELKAPVDVVAAMGKYAACQVQLSDATEAPPSALAEAPPSHYEEKDDDPENSEMNETVSNPDNDSLKTDESDVSNTCGDGKAIQQEQHRPVEGEPRQKDADSKEQKYVPRRAYQYQRGGSRGGGGGSEGRRGYANGRGGRGGRGGGYQNGRSQYFDPGYHPKNYYAAGRGSRGGGSAIYSHVGATDGGHVLANVELGASS